MRSSAQVRLTTFPLTICTDVDFSPTVAKKHVVDLPCPVVVLDLVDPCVYVCIREVAIWFKQEVLNLSTSC